MYEIVIERQDERFRAYCPALPGCEADGASKEEVIERMYEIIPQRIAEAG
jgi:predicted RNase H-like HicB family nuclease